MLQSIGEFRYLLTEYALTLGIIILIFISAFQKRTSSEKLINTISITTVLIGISLSIVSIPLDKSDLFSELLLNDGFGFFSQTVILFATLLIFISNIGYQNSLESKKGEYHLLILGIALGAIISVRSENLLTIFLGFELIAICSYALTAMGNSKQSSEAALKYLIFGTVITGIGLYGFSFLYGLTGNLNFGSNEFLASFSEQLPWFKSSILILSVSFFLFKITVMPFHFWTPDVYEKAPTPIVALFSTVPKIAGFVILYRLIHLIPQAFNTALVYNSLLVLAIVSITVGNIIALVQNNAKRLMAYSSISQSGLLLLVLVISQKSSFESLMYYLIVYIFMNTAFFYLISILEKEDKDIEFENLKGKGRLIPALGIISVLISLALAGLPPTAGFTAKLWIFSDLWKSYVISNNNLVLISLIIAVLNTVLALFYYLKLPYYLFSKVETAKKIKIKTSQNLILLGLSLPLIGIFLFSEKLSHLIKIINELF